MIPVVFALAAEELLPTLPTPVTRDLGLFLESHVGQTFMSGNWGWFAFLVARFCSTPCSARSCCSAVCCCRGCKGVFGRWDWAGNGLFALYHLHVPWVIPQTFVDAIVPYASKRYNSALVGIAAHSVQSGLLHRRDARPGAPLGRWRFLYGVQAGLSHRWDTLGTEGGLVSGQVDGGALEAPDGDLAARRT